MSVIADTDVPLPASHTVGLCRWSVFNQVATAQGLHSALLLLPHLLSITGARRREQ